MKISEIIAEPAYIALWLGSAVLDLPVLLGRNSGAAAGGLGFFQFGGRRVVLGVGAARDDLVLLGGRLGVVGQLAVDPQL